MKIIQFSGLLTLKKTPSHLLTWFWKNCRPRNNIPVQCSVVNRCCYAPRYTCDVNRTQLAPFDMLIQCFSISYLQYKQTQHSFHLGILDGLTALLCTRDCTLLYRLVDTERACHCTEGDKTVIFAPLYLCSWSRFGVHACSRPFLLCLTLLARVDSTSG